MHFLTLADIGGDNITKLTRRALELKQLLKNKGGDKGASPQVLSGKSIIMLFEKPSTRTRVSFEVGISQLGGNVVFISGKDSQMSRGEPIKDTAIIMSSMATGIIIRCNSHQDITEFAKYSSVPLVNALTDESHPCQVLADLTTYQELRGEIKNKKVVWLGDYNNMCKTYIEAAALMDFELWVAAPNTLVADAAGAKSSQVKFTTDIAAAIKDAALVTTDVWASMGDDNVEEKKRLLKPYQVTSDLLDQAAKDVLFLHCLPANEGEEVAQGLLDDKRSGVWVQGENRLHAQKALLEFLFTRPNT